MSKNNPTKAERQYMARVAEYGCILCHHLGLGESPAECHHPRTGVGAGSRSSHMDVIGLCPRHHRLGNESFHVMGRLAFERHYGITEVELWMRTKELLTVTKK